MFYLIIIASNGLHLRELKSLGHENVAFCWLCLQLEVLKRKSLLEDLSNNFTHIGMHDLWYEFAVFESKAQNSKKQSQQVIAFQSLDVEANGLTVRAHGLEALTNLSYLYWSASVISPWLDGIKHLTNLILVCIGNFTMVG